MRKSLILALTALGGSASYGAGITQTSPGTATPDPATWRWHVSSILDEQREAAAPKPQNMVADFGHLYQRYTPLGLLQRK